MKTKKELKESYKEMKSKIGVFQIKNTINNKIFVESSTDLNAIWNRHKFQLKNGLHPNVALQSDWNEHGEDNFTYEILSEIKQDDNNQKDYKKEAQELHEMFLEELQPFDENGYNIARNQKQAQVKR